MAPSAACLPQWLALLKELNAPQSDIDWLVCLFVLGLSVVPDGAVVDPIHLPNYPSAVLYEEELLKYLDSEVESGFMLKTKVGDGPTPARVCPLAFIPKPEPGAFRMITDASAPIGFSPNSVNNKIPFRMVTPADILARVGPGFWGAKTDVKAAFRNLPLSPPHAGLLAVEVGGFYYWELRCPFGWILAPYNWCRVSAYIQAFCALKGYNIVVYVDDFLHLAPTKGECEKSQAFLIALLESLGLPEKESKRVTPSQSVEFIGFIFNLATPSVAVSPERIDNILTDIHVVASSKQVHVKTFQNLVGKLVFASQVVLGGRAFTRRLYDSLMEANGNWVIIKPSTLADLLWWSKYFKWANGRKVLHWAHERPLARCCTDASDMAGGALFNSSAWSHVWSHKQSLWHINIKELWSVYHSLVLWSSQWAGHDVVLGIDNTVVCAWLNNGTARSPQAMALLRKIYWYTAKRDIRLSTQWLPSSVNVAADALSRLDWNVFIASTDLPLSSITLSGGASLHAFPIYPHSPPSVPHHSQTLFWLKKKSPPWLERVYSPHWQSPPKSLIEVPGTPSLGFAWPSSGLPFHLLKPFFAIMPPGCTFKASPMAQSAITSLPFLHCTHLLAQRLTQEKQSALSWVESYKVSDGVQVTSPRTNNLSPSSFSQGSDNMLTSMFQDSWLTGRPCVWVCSPSFDQQTWYQKLKDLGNKVLSYNVMTAILRSSVPYFISVGQRRCNSCRSPFASQSHSYLAPLSAQSPPYVPLSHAVPLVSLPVPFSPGLTLTVSPTNPSPSLSKPWLARKNWIQIPSHVTVPEVEVPLKLPGLAVNCTGLKPKGFGNQMLFSSTSNCLVRSNGPSLC